MQIVRFLVSVRVTVGVMDKSTTQKREFNEGWGLVEDPLMLAYGATTDGSLGPLVDDPIVGQWPPDEIDAKRRAPYGDRARLFVAARYLAASTLRDPEMPPTMAAVRLAAGLVFAVIGLGLDGRR